MKKPLSLTVSILFLSSSVFAQERGIELTTPTEPSVSDSASQSSSANMIGQAQNLITSGLMFDNARRELARTHPNYPRAAMYAAFGMLTLAQANEHGNSAGMSAYTANLSNAGGNGYDKTGVEDLLRGSVPQVRAISSNIKSLQDSGLLSKDLKSVKIPDGKKYNTSDFASKSAMAGAGVPGSAIASGLAAMNAANKKAAEITEKLKIGSLTESAGYEDGGGSGSSKFASSGEDTGSQFGGVAGGGVGATNEREPANLAGMQKDYNGEPIGVAADSIFLMMSRRYKVKEGQEAFFSEKDLVTKK